MRSQNGRIAQYEEQYTGQECVSRGIRANLAGIRRGGRAESPIAKYQYSAA